MGDLYYQGEKPTVGTKVLVIVDEVNKPTGMWDGTLTEVGMNEMVEYRGCDFSSVTCTVTLTDSLLLKDPLYGDFMNGEPHVNYSVYVATAGSDYLRKRLANANTEIRGLKRRVEIERGVWHAALKVITNAEAFEQLRKLLEDFQHSFFEKLSR